MTLFKASRLPRPATPAYEYIRIPASPPASVARVEPSGSPRRAVSLPSGSLQVGLYNLGRFVRYCRSRAACRHEPIGSLPGRSWARRLEEVVGLCLALRSSLVPPGAPGASRPMVGAAAPSAEAGSLGADRVVDLGDVTLLPGFVDSHVHLTATGLGAHGANLRGARSAA